MAPINPKKKTTLIKLKDLSSIPANSEDMNLNFAQLFHIADIFISTIIIGVFLLSNCAVFFGNSCSSIEMWFCKAFILSFIS